MTQAAYIDGSWRCYESPDGIRKRFIGCRHILPRSAVAHTVAVYVSPLRASDEEPTPIPVPPSGLSGQSGSSSEPPSATHGLSVEDSPL
jgi:hypothetical protein